MKYVWVLVSDAAAFSSHVRHILGITRSITSIIR